MLNVKSLAIAGLMNLVASSSLYRINSDLTDQQIKAYLDFMGKHGRTTNSVTEF